MGSYPLRLVNITWLDMGAHRFRLCLRHLATNLVVAELLGHTALRMQRIRVALAEPAHARDPAAVHIFSKHVNGFPLVRVIRTVSTKLSYTYCIVLNLITSILLSFHETKQTG